MSATGCLEPQAAPLCPTCTEPFSSMSERFPHSLPCGHCVCKECADSLRLLPSPACSLCGADICDDAIPNTGLALFADGVTALLDCPDEPPFKRAASEPVIIPAPLCTSHNAPVHAYCTACNGVVCPKCAAGDCRGHKLTLLAEVDAAKATMRTAFLDSVGACKSFGAKMIRAIDAVQAAKARMVARTAASLESVDEQVAALKAAIDARVASAKAAAQKELNARVKQLDAQLDSLMVTAGQIVVARDMCAAACDDARRSVMELATTLQAACSMRGLLQQVMTPAVCTVVEVATCDTLDPVLVPLDSWLYVRTAVAADVNFRMRGHLAAFVPGAERTVSLVVTDVNGQRVTSLYPADITVQVEGVRDELQGSSPRDSDIDVDAATAGAAPVVAAAADGGTGSEDGSDDGDEVCAKGQETRVLDPAVDVAVEADGAGMFTIKYTVREDLVKVKFTVNVAGVSDTCNSPWEASLVRA